MSFLAITAFLSIFLKSTTFLFSLLFYLLFCRYRSRLNDILRANEITVSSLKSDYRLISQDKDVRSYYREYVCLRGKVSTLKKIKTTYSEEDCVCFKSQVSEEYTTALEAMDEFSCWLNSLNKKRKIIQSGVMADSFFLKDIDNNDMILVCPEGAKIELTKVANFSSRDINYLDSVQFSNKFITKYINSYLIEEWILPLDKTILVIGEVSDSDGELKVAFPQNSGRNSPRTFMISLAKSKKELLKHIRKRVLLSFVLFLIFLSLFAYYCLWPVIFSYLS